MELRHLRYLLAVANEGSFTRAAAALHLAQQALSQQIADLERELDFKIFQRLSRGVRPTPAGAVFLHEARAIIAESERAVAQARRVARGDERRIGVGVPLCHAPDADAFLTRFRRRYPAAELELHPMLSREQPAALQHGTIDVALGFAPMGPEDDGVADEVVGVAPLTCVFLPADHPLAGRDSVRLHELQATPVLLPEREVSPYAIDQLTAELAARGLKLTPSDLRVRGVPSVAHVALANAWLPWFEGTEPAPGTVCLPIADAPLIVRIWLLWRREDQAPTVARFVSSCRGPRVQAEAVRA